MSTNTASATVRRENALKIQLQAASDGEMKYGSAGKPWASVRGFFSQGKDKASGEFLPSIWFTVKAFSPNTEPGAEVVALDAIKKGDKFVAYGHIGLDEWTDKNENVRQSMTLYAYKVERINDDAPAPTELEGEL
ncbi:MAG: hypothetical protein CO094_05690 [Anaerolineae bacterium CG_4_9_14_3_um_filter_57_17]|nr:hypothetical protein [bacterium]NCT19749.1 hypothetical protein [bacterium]OIO85189.1 MAG: hypothetical protein AUK01_06825 [Anaerolineae bacterium CG2_30_57_67]PJB66913.1 MAG: hypothetical protein CO094_05690 [Anaerolineae bacterium CG_4_9_14_3_um_filter_57_17]